MYDALASMPPPSKLLPWTEVHVWLEDPVLRSVRAPLSHRRAIVALARWKAGDPPANLRYADVADLRQLGSPSEVDWSGFPPSSTEPHG